MEQTKTCWNIASATKPKNFQGFVDALKAAAEEHGELKLIAFVAAPGYGCANYGLMLQGASDKAERFVTQVTMAVQPAKYSALASDPLLVEGEFSNRM